MRLLLLLSIAGFVGIASGQDLASQVRGMEAKGNSAAARDLLAEAVRNSPNDPVALSFYAEFLDRHGDPAAREVYARLLGVLDKSGGDRKQTARRLVILDLLNGDRASAATHLAAYRNAGGRDLGEAIPESKPRTTGQEWTSIDIPGPLRSFNRMAALSPDLPADEILPALARNVVTNGYQAANSSEGLEQTEFLKLVVRYLTQARELAKLAGDAHKIQIDQCESTITGDLLKILGYRMRGACGAEVVLETVNASRAFLTIDSGFPLAELETALRSNRPFSYPYGATSVPILYTAEYWLGAKEKTQGEFIDAFLSDPQLCRLYLGVSKLDRETADAMKAGVPVMRLKAFSHVLDFFGGMFYIRDGKAVVPGGPKAEAIWAELAGASPADPAAFFERLVAKDDGWLCSYFDAISRISGPVQEFLTQPARLRRYYGAVKGRLTSPGPARPVFRANTDLLLLTTRLRLDPDGSAHVPGNVEIWKNLFVKHPHGKYDGKLTKSAVGWKESDDVIEALFALSRKAVENEPLRIYMALSDMNRRREKPLLPTTVDRLAREYRTFGAQYPVLNETPKLTDETIVAYLDLLAAEASIRDQGVRADAAGTLQALVSFWQIFLRQGSIPQTDADKVFNQITSPFAKVKSERDVFAAGLEGVKALLTATKSRPDVSPQDRMLDLLAGFDDEMESEAHITLVQDLMKVFEAQRLVSLQAIFDLSDHLDAIGKGAKVDPAIIARVAQRLADVQLPRAGLSGVEKNSLLFGYYAERHIENQRKLNLRAAIEKAAGNPERLAEIKGNLAPLLRDTLVGLNYAHYAPPGAQILYTNPIFVRSHDFLGMQGANQTWRHTEVVGTGWPASAGGRLVGSLVSLSYALAEAEQNFLIPSREQALIWGDLVPQMVQSAKVPRYWEVTPNQMHFTALHLRYADALLAEAALNASLRTRVVETLQEQAPPARARLVGRLLADGDVGKALENVTPAESFVLAMRLVGVEGLGDQDLAGEIRRLAKAAPESVNYAAISKLFGTPKPTLTNSYQPELLYLRTFPTLMGYSSRVMAESWESSALYYAAVADALYLNPGQLNVVIPEWTRNTVERIFATHLEDWPALLRSLRQVGHDAVNKRTKVASAAGLE